MNNPEIKIPQAEEFFESSKIKDISADHYTRLCYSNHNSYESIYEK